MLGLLAKVPRSVRSSEFMSAHQHKFFQIRGRGGDTTFSFSEGPWMEGGANVC